MINSYYSITLILFNEFNELYLLHLYWNLVKIWRTSSKHELPLTELNFSRVV